MKRVLALLTALWADTVRLPEYRNVAVQAGLTHHFPNGGTQSKTHIIETTGSGVGMIDYNNDGFVDLFVVSGQGGMSRLYQNDRKGRFTDVTAAAGLARDGWGQGVCVGDYDNDGFTDLFVTYWGQNSLYHNQSGRRFQNVTVSARLQQDRVRYNTGCAFFDYDNDGDLDLFVANYLRFDFETAPKPGENPYCWYRGLAVNCGPRGLPFDSNLIYRNNGDGTFTDVSAASGISKPGHNYCLGVVTGDFDQNGWTDLYVACDQTPSLMYMNQGNGKFTEEALLRGTALDENGKALSGMGAAAADYDGDGWVDLFRTNFSDERETLYRNRGRGEFDEATTSAGMAHNTRFVGWGCAFLDFDNDGWKDVLLVNGHAFPEVDRLNIDIRYKDRAILYHNLGNGKFADISERSGPAIMERHAARGLAIGDVDNDGSVEAVVNSQNEPPALLRNAAKPQGHWIILKLDGRRSNRSAIGARVRVTAGGRSQVDEVRGGGSYLSQHDLRLYFGLGDASQIERIGIRWPSGLDQTLSDRAPNQILTIVEPDGGAGAH